MPDRSEGALDVPTSPPDRQSGEDVPPTRRIEWVLECGCEPMVNHCGQCDHRRQVLALVKVEEAVQRACEAIYANFRGYWPSEYERAHIAVALLHEHLPPHAPAVVVSGGDDHR